LREISPENADFFEETIEVFSHQCFQIKMDSFSTPYFCRNIFIRGIEGQVSQLLSSKISQRSKVYIFEKREFSTSV